LAGRLRPDQAAEEDRPDDPAGAGRAEEERAGDGTSQVRRPGEADLPSVSPSVLGSVWVAAMTPTIVTSSPSRIHVIASAATDQPVPARPRKRVETRGDLGLGRLAPHILGD
jgi:hypothetical protein